MSAKRIFRGTVVATAGVLILAACGSGSSSDSGSGGSAQGGTHEVPGVPQLEEQFTPDEHSPPTTAPPLATDKSVWYVQCGAQIPGCVTKGKYTAEAAEAAGWEFKLADGNLGISDGFNTAVRSAIAADADAIIVDSFSCEPARQSLVEAKEAGIPVLGIETIDCSEFDGGPDLYTVDFIPSETVKTNLEWFQQRGIRSAQYAIAATGGETMVINSPGLSDPDYETESDAFTAEMENCETCEIVGESPWREADLTPNGPWITGLRAQFVQHPDANAVHFPYEAFSLTLGGAAALETAGLDAIAFGGVADPGGIEAVRDGTLTAITNARSVEWEGWAAIDTLNRHFNGEPSVPQGVGMAIIDNEHNMPDSGDEYVASIDFKSIYKKAWGIE